MKTNKIVLGLDIDGTLYDWHDAVYTFYQYEMRYPDTYSNFWSSYWRSLSLDRREYLASIPILYETKVPPACVLDFLEFAAQRSEIYYITHRPSEVERVTRKYFKKYNFPFQDNLIMTGDKANACRLYGVTHFLDDFASHIEKVKNIADSYLLARAWNRDERDGHNVVYSLKEFRERVFNE